MIKVTSIDILEPYFLVCRFNTGITKKLDVFPLIQNHEKLKGIEKLLDGKTFKKVRIGDAGEIVWDKIITTSYRGEDQIWDYDISPEFAFENALQID